MLSLLDLTTAMDRATSPAERIDVLLTEANDSYTRTAELAPHANNTARLVDALEVMAFGFAGLGRLAVADRGTASYLCQRWPVCGQSRQDNSVPGHLVCSAFNIMLGNAFSAAETSLRWSKMAEHASAGGEPGGLGLVPVIGALTSQDLLSALLRAMPFYGLDPAVVAKQTQRVEYLTRTVYQRVQPTSDLLSHTNWARHLPGAEQFWWLQDPADGSWPEVTAPPDLAPPYQAPEDSICHPYYALAHNPRVPRPSARETPTA